MDRTYPSRLAFSKSQDGLTQRQLADRLKRPQSNIAKIEAGKTRVELVEFVAISKALKLDPRVLLERFLRW
jgi:transcriptional regulator with XRE-family HTH domain